MLIFISFALRSSGMSSFENLTIHNKGVFRTLPIIHDGMLLRKQWAAKRRYIFCLKASIINVLLGPKHASEPFPVCRKRMHRSSRLEVFFKKVVLVRFTKFMGKHLFQGLFLTTLQAQTFNLISKKLLHKCFPVNFAKLLTRTFYFQEQFLLKNTCGNCF